MAADVLAEIPAVKHVLLFDIEKHFDANPHRAWMEANWTCSVLVGALYVLVIFGLREMMRGRSAFGLRSALAVWSGALAVFSILGTLRTAPELFHVLSTYGLSFSVCNPSFYLGPSGFWVLLYTWSKVVELGDTLFIVLRKQPLIFLHWYHHLVTLIYMFLSYKDFIGLGRWGITMNYAVHAVMYSYYTARAAGVAVPRAVRSTVTGLQLTQMAAGVALNGCTYYLLIHRLPCQQTYLNNILSFIMYSTYLLLFANFFHKTYIKKRK